MLDNNAYTFLSRYYDYMLKHVDYEAWYKFLRNVMTSYIDKPVNVLELGCGTGKFGPKFSSDDFKITGIDKSIEMLKIAKLRAYKNFKVACYDITNFHLKKKFDFIFCVHDTLNYLLNYKQINKLINCVKNIMHNDSIFLFDVTSEYNIIENFENKTFTFYKNNTHIIWTNKYNNKNKILHSKIKFINNSKIYIENHYQRLYTIDEIKKIILKNNLELVKITGDYSLKPIKDDTIMINFIVKRKND